MNRRTRTAALAGITLIVALGTAVVPSTAAQADATTAVVRSAHFSPDTPGVDVYLQPYSGGSTTLWITSETYGEVSNYQRLAPGVYVVSMRPHGAAASTPPAVTWTLDAKAGGAYTAAAIGRNAALQAVVLTDDLAATAAGTGRVRLVQAASSAASVSVIANGGLSLASKLAFGTVTGYQTVPVGTWDVRATPDTGSATPATVEVGVAAGSSSTVVVVDNAQGGLGVLSVLDSGAPAATPVGSIDAGAGGTATPAMGTGTILGVVAAGAGASLLVLLVARRRRTVW